MKLTDNFSVEEMVISQAASRLGLQNYPDFEAFKNLGKTANGLERIRSLVKFPITVTSGYRSPEVNDAIGGSVDSQHCQGQAADIICPQFGSPYDLAKLISENLGVINFDQLILELGAWVHVSFAPQPRRHVLTKLRGSGQIVSGLSLPQPLV